MVQPDDPYGDAEFLEAYRQFKAKRHKWKLHQWGLPENFFAVAVGCAYAIGWHVYVHYVAVYNSPAGWSLQPVYDVDVFADVVGFVVFGIIGNYYWYRRRKDRQTLL